MIETILKGLFIGILVSAPMGPIGVLCVQRTLHEGRFHGFVSGLGASMSDLLYAIISGLGVSIIMDFILENHYPLQILGSILLLVVGYFIYNSNPVKKLLKQDEPKSPYWKNLVSSFFLNLSNIGILFFFIAMFARFNFISSNVSQNILGILCIGIGAVLWWFLISTVVDRVRSKFNPRGLKVFNNILGVVLIVIGVVGLISGTYSLINIVLHTHA